MTSNDIRRVAAPADDDDVIELPNPLDDSSSVLRRNDAQAGLVSLAHERASGTSQYKNWVFTWNNPDVSEDNQYKGANLWMYFRSRQHLDIKYMAWSYEVGESGTPHYQGFIMLKNKMRKSTMRAKFNNASIWVDAAMSAHQARKYCLHQEEFKDKALVHNDDVWEFGKWEEVAPSQGKRTELSSVTDMIMKGSSLKEAAQADPATFVKFHSGLSKLESMFQMKKRSWMTELFIYWGKAGSGKSHRAREEALAYLHQTGSISDEDIYYCSAPAKKTDKMWMHGYEGESCVIIDDFYGTIGIDVMKNLIDKYPCKVEVKNGHRQWLARKVWITSNQPWESWWGVELMRGDNKKAIERRITSIIEMNDVYQERFYLPAGILGEGVSDDAILPNFMNEEPANSNEWGWE